MSKAIMAGALLAAAGASASANLVITEIWAGGFGGAEATSDWVEITNFGASAVSLAGTYYDDDSADPTKNDPLEGIASIAAGESVIVLISWEDDYATSTDAISAFTATWGAGNLAGVQIGYVTGGSGLGGGGDAAFFFDGNTAGANTIASQAYAGPTEAASFIYNPNTGLFGDSAQAGVFGAFNSVLPASDAGADPAVGSPGLVPAPASAALIGVGGLVATRRRR
ncbi:MAG: hypothetical protein R3B49_07710 [Phycisphaerales bacterium]